MTEVLEKSGTQPPGGIDRPAWIPSQIVADWDPSPYAYQTGEELMSHGTLHDLILTYLGQVMPNHLARFGLALWKDLFLLYRNPKGVKKRIGPDLLLAKLDLELVAGSWDLDSMAVPEFLGEITSPHSRSQDFESKRKLYRKLGVRRYMVIDGHDERAKLTGQIKVHLWLDEQEQQTGEDGFLDVPELHIKVKPIADELIFYHADTLEPLLDMKTAEEQIDSLAKENASQAKLIQELEEKLKELGK